MMLLTILSSGKCITTLILLGSSLVPSLLATWPKNVILFATKQHLFGFNFRFISLSLKNTTSKCWDVPPNSHCVHWNHQQIPSGICPPNSIKTSNIVMVKVLAAFLRPNGMTVQSYNPMLVINVIFFISSSAIQICQKPDYKSNVVNQEDFPNWVITSSTSDTSRNLWFCN